MGKTKSPPRKKSAGLNSGQAIKPKARNRRAVQRRASPLREFVPEENLRGWLESMGEPIEDPRDMHRRFWAEEASHRKPDGLYTQEELKSLRKAMHWRELLGAVAAAMSAGDVSAALTGMYRLGKDYDAYSKASAKARSAKAAGATKVSALREMKDRCIEQAAHELEQSHKQKQDIGREACANKVHIALSPGVKPRTVYDWIKPLFAK